MSSYTFELHRHDPHGNFALFNLALWNFESSPTADTAIAVAELFEQHAGMVASLRDHITAITNRDVWLARAAELAEQEDETWQSSPATAA